MKPRPLVGSLNTTRSKSNRPAPIFFSSCSMWGLRGCGTRFAATPPPLFLHVCNPVDVWRSELIDSVSSVPENLTYACEGSVMLHKGLPHEKPPLSSIEWT